MNNVVVIEDLFRRHVLKLFLLVAVTTILLAIENYNEYHAYKIGDWLINYQAGFIRRGFFGEFLFILHDISRINLGIEIEAAAEYFYDETLVARLPKNDFLTFGEKNVLIEFSFSSEPRGYNEFFFDMLMKDYKPVVAHFERYSFLHGSVEKAEDLRNKGVLIQMNLNSLSGHYGPSVKKQAELLVDSGQIDFIASDCHRIDHLNQIENLLTSEYLHKVLELPLKNKFL